MSNHIRSLRQTLDDPISSSPAYTPSASPRIGNERSLNPTPPPPRSRFRHWHNIFRRKYHFYTYLKKLISLILSRKSNNGSRSESPSVDQS